MGWGNIGPTPVELATRKLIRAARKVVAKPTTLATDELRIALDELDAERAKEGI